MEETRTYTIVHDYKRCDPSWRKRPYIDVRLEGNVMGVWLLGLVDSGADICLFNDRWAGLLGLDRSTARLEKVEGLESEIEVEMLHVRMVVAGATFDAEVGFSPAVSEAFGILGRHPLFEHLHIGFDQPAERVLCQPVARPR